MNVDEIQKEFGDMIKIVDMIETGEICSKCSGNIIGTKDELNIISYCVNCRYELE